jgi:GT2 family glycosyltransferase
MTAGMIITHYDKRPALFALPHVTVGVINFNGLGTLPGTLASLLALDYPSYDIRVVDNGSTDGSREWLLGWLNEHTPLADGIFYEENRGASAARQALLENSQAPYVFFVDNDILVERGALSSLVEVLGSGVEAAACHPEICDDNDPSVYHYNGGWMNYLGVYLSRPCPKDGEVRPEYEPFAVTSSGALLVDRCLALSLGGFDRDFFFNMEDGDFTARLTLAGYACLNVPGARVYHCSRPRHKSKVYFQVRNRLFFMLKLYSWRTLLLAAPALFFFELSQAALLVLQGAGRPYLQANLDFLSQLPAVLEKRRRFQHFRRVRDRDWLASGEMYLPPSLFKKAWLRRLANLYSRTFDLYWHLVKPLC